MAPIKSTSIVLAAVFTVGTVGIEAAGWVVDPRYGGVMFVFVMAGLGWIALVWSGYLINLEATKELITIPTGIRYPIQLGAAAIVIFIVSQAIKVPAPFGPNCTPKFEWLDRVDIVDQKGTNAQQMVQFARVVPVSERPYTMKLVADGGGLLALQVIHQRIVQDRDRMWQLRPSGIAYKAYFPFGLVKVIIVAKTPADVDFQDPQFACAR